MSIRMMNAVWDLELPNHTKKLVLIALADNANDQGVCWPSMETLAQKCSMGRTGVHKVIHELVHLGLITIEPHRGRASSYALTLPVHGMNTPQGKGVHGMDTPVHGMNNPAPPNLYSPPHITINDPKVPPISPKGGNDAEKLLLKAFREKFPYHVKGDPKATAEELAAARALLASATANEILDLAEAAQADRFPGNRRAASSLRNLARHFAELCAQFSGRRPGGAAKIAEFGGEKTLEELWEEWDSYEADCIGRGKDPDYRFRPELERPGKGAKTPQDGLGGIQVPPASSSPQAPGVPQRHTP